MLETKYCWKRGEHATEVTKCVVIPTICCYVVVMLLYTISINYTE